MAKGNRPLEYRLTVTVVKNGQKPVFREFGLAGLDNVVDALLEEKMRAIEGGYDVHVRVVTPAQHFLTEVAHFHEPACAA